MKTLFLIKLIIVFHSPVYCQWVEHIIPQQQTAFPFENTIKLTDLDGDGLDDIVYSTQSQGMYWRKNLGNGDFESQELIIDPISGEQTRWFDAGDINNNGFTDIVLAYFTTNGGVYWHENLDGQGTFSAGNPLQIPSGAQSFHTKIADIDNDGNPDIIITFKFQTQVTRVMWYKNLGNGQFDTGNIIVQDNDFPQEFEIGDIDGDGDLDVVIGSTTLNRLSWFENIDGQGTFGSPIPIGFLNASTLRLQLGDINGNGFLDIVADFGMIEDRSLVWFENLNGQGNYSEAQVIVNEITSNTGFSIVDIDNDGNQDLYFVNLASLFWIENLDGLGDFGSLLSIGTATYFPNPIDINEDGFIDVLLICSTPTHFCWYENRVLSTQRFIKFQATVDPNPAKEKIHITSNQPIDKIELFTVLGQKFLYEGSKNTEQSIEINSFPRGLYFITVSSVSSKQTLKLIKK